MQGNTYCSGDLEVLREIRFVQRGGYSEICTSSGIPRYFFAVLRTCAYYLLCRMRCTSTRADKGGVAGAMGRSGAIAQFYFGDRFLTGMSEVPQFEARRF